MTERDRSAIVNFLSKSDGTKLSGEDALAALQRIWQGKGGVVRAAWQDMPTPYELDAMDSDAVVTMFRAVISVALKGS